MPNPPPSLSFEHVPRPESGSQASQASPRSTGVQNLNDADAVHQTSYHELNADFAYATSPTSGAALGNPSFATDGSSHTQNADTSVGAPYSSFNTSTDAHNLPNLNLASFGSQPWPTTSAPFLNFAPHPLYEPTGELAHETIEGFEHYDSSSSIRHADWPSELEKIAGLPRATSATSNSAFQSLEHVRDAQPFPKPALKRPLEAEVVPISHQQSDQPLHLSQSKPRKIRRVSFEQMSGTGPGSADDEDPSSSEGPDTSRPATRQPAPVSAKRARVSKPSNVASQRPSTQHASTQPPRPTASGSKTPSAHSSSILPLEKVFPIQIGSELFRLSGASISSDAPSYFTQFFEEQIRQNEESGGVRTLYIDRDPETFRDVARHLQGYYVKPRDGSHFVKLFADAQFYSLPRLIDQLFESEIFIQIGERHFQIPKDIFSDPGNSPNFFSLGFAVFFSTPGEVFPGLDRRGLLRPPSITPPYVPGRSAETFAQLLHLLRGYPLHIRDEQHRAELLRDCRYFHLRGLEQKVIAHSISYNLERQQHEICLRIEDIKPSGISYKSDETEAERATTGGWVRYARPFVDDDSYELIVEIGGESTIIELDEMRADFHGLAKARVSSLFQVVANKMNLPTKAPLGAMMLSRGAQSSHASPGHTPLSEDRVKVRFDTASDITLDGSRYEVDWDSALGQCMSNGPVRPSDNDKDAMDDSASSDPAPQRSRTRTGQQSKKQTTGERQSTGLSSRTDTASSSAPRKRRRPTLSSSETSGHGEWIVRTAQWRLRVQPNVQDTIRGGYEIAFIAVKIDAYSQERARNARRGFLSGS